jgi:Dolichyl-phosphate-mannose-protein mannosyltransferase
MTPANRSSGPGWPFLLALALLYTLLNAVKPLQVDDTAYYYYAAQLAAHPADPYGFTVFWYQWPQPANTVLAPPVLPYWWSLALRLFGEQPFWWKVWLLPFSLLFVVALASLFRRFARGLERPLLLLTVLSPAFLPSLNLMLDVPALALGLSALAVFLRACDRNALAPALLAGVLAGLAMQTKYTGLLVPLTVLLYAALARRLGLALAAVAVAGLLFAGWEEYVAHRYGDSHFLYHVRRSDETLADKALAVGPLLSLFGGVAPAVGLLGLAGLGGRRRGLLAAGALTALGFLAVALVPDSRVGGLWYWPGEAIFGGLAFAVCAVLAAVVGRLLRRRRIRPDVLFLVGWLGLEAAGAVALTPFPAVRRVLGIVVVATLLAGRLASRTCRAPEQRRLVHGVTAGGVLLGLLFYAVDLRDAVAQQEAVAAAVAVPRPGATVWYVGHWSFQFYAERAGMRPVVPDESRLGPGDWVVGPDERFEQQHIDFDPDRVQLVRELTVRDALPLRTVRCYYGGFTPLQHLAGPRVVVRVGRVTADWVPASPRFAERRQ